MSRPILAQPAHQGRTDAVASVTRRRAQPIAALEPAPDAKAESMLRLRRGALPTPQDKLQQRETRSKKQRAFAYPSDVASLLLLTAEQKTVTIVRRGDPCRIVECHYPR